MTAADWSTSAYIHPVFLAGGYDIHEAWSSLNSTDERTVYYGRNLVHMNKKWTRTRFTVNIPRVLYQLIVMPYANIILMKLTGE